jgi:hypothetical protein
MDYSLNSEANFIFMHVKKETSVFWSFFYLYVELCTPCEQKSIYVFLGSTKYKCINNSNSKTPFTSFFHAYTYLKAS